MYSLDSVKLIITFNNIVKGANDVMANAQHLKKKIVSEPYCYVALLNIDTKEMYQNLFECFQNIWKIYELTVILGLSDLS